MRNLRCEIQYDGTNYNGWQSQPNGRTIQGTITDSIRKIVSEDVNLLSAGRTDAGVHALRQVISFKTASSLNENRLQCAMNALLPSDIRVMDITEADAGFHPRYDAVMKTYMYLIYTSSALSPFVGSYVWHVKGMLDYSVMVKAASFLRGKHDFASFMGSGSDAKDTERSIYMIELRQCNELPFLGVAIKGDFVVLEITADGFLRHMVRNIVGTLVDVGQGRLSADSIVKILDHRDRRLAGVTAPSKGLFLKRVYY